VKAEAATCQHWRPGCSNIHTKRLTVYRALTNRTSWTGLFKALVTAPAHVLNWTGLGKFLRTDRLAGPWFQMHYFSLFAMCNDLDVVHVSEHLVEFKSFWYAILIRHVLTQPGVRKVEAGAPWAVGVRHPSLEFLWVHSVTKVENLWGIGV